MRFTACFLAALQLDSDTHALWIVGPDISLAFVVYLRRANTNTAQIPPLIYALSSAHDPFPRLNVRCGLRLGALKQCLRLRPLEEGKGEEC